MYRLFYLVLLGCLAMPTHQALADTLPNQPKPETYRPVDPTNTSDRTDVLNARSLARSRPVRPSASQIPQSHPTEGTIAKGTGVVAPELLEAPVYNPADRR